MSWIQRAKVGDKVACVDDTTRHGRFWQRGRKPVVGAVYTISRIFVDETGKDPGEILFELAEIGIFRDERGNRLGYRPARFRPVSGRKTDISWAHEILRKATPSAKEVV